MCTEEGPADVSGPTPPRFIEQRSKYFQDDQDVNDILEVEEQQRLASLEVYVDWEFEAANKCSALNAPTDWATCTKTILPDVRESTQQDTDPVLSQQEHMLHRSIDYLGLTGSRGPQGRFRALRLG